MKNSEIKAIRRVYFLVAFILWYIWLGITPSLGQGEPKKSLKDVLVGKATYGVVMYYLVVRGWVSEIIPANRGP